MGKSEGQRAAASGAEYGRADLADVFVGRDRERAELHAAVEAAVAARGSLLLVTGEPGMGKTRLGWEVTEYAHRVGAQPVWGSCWEGDGAPAYWPWQQVLRRLTAEAAMPGTDDALDRPGWARLFPDLATGVEVPALSSDPEAARFRLFGEVREHLVSAAVARPLVLILDDLQWADLPSLRLLQFLAPQLRSLPLVVVGTYRDVEIDDPARAKIFAALDRSTLRIALRGLSAAELGRFVAAAAGAATSAMLAAELHRRTGGNPFFAREVMRLLLAQGVDTADAAAVGVPATVSEVVERRLARLPQPVTDLLAVAAVVGESVPLEALTATTRQPMATLVDLLDAASRAGLISQRFDDAGTIAFAHALVRETLYENLGPAGRAEVHARVGLGLESVAGTDPGELAHHFLRAGPAGARDRAVRYAVQAGRRALDALAHEQAQDWFQRALTCTGDDGDVGGEARIEALLGRAEARRRAGDLPGAREDLQCVLTAARRTGAATAFARAALMVHLLGVESGRAHDEPVALLDEARRALPDSEADLKANVLSSLSRERRHSIDDVNGSAAPLSDEALTLARQAGTAATLARALLARHDALWAFGTGGERVRISEEMETAAQRSGDVELRVEAVLLQATALLELGDPAVHARLDRLHEMTTGLQQPRLTYLTLTRQAMQDTMCGEFGRARSLIDEATAVAARGNEPDAGNVADTLEFALASLTGQRACLADRRPSRIAGHWPGFPAYYTLALLAAGRHEEARQVFVTVASTKMHRQPYLLWNMIHLPYLAQVAVAFDDPELIAECYGALRPYAGTTCVIAAAVAFCGAVDHHLGVLALAMERADDAAAHLEEALAIHERLRARPWAALTRYWLARAVLARDGEVGREQVTELVRRVKVTADELGMIELSASAAELMAGQQRVGSMRRVGGVWTLAWDGREVSVPDAKGLRDLATLLARPGHEVAATDLVAARTGGPAPSAASADPMLDNRARAAYRARLAALEDEIDEADLRHDFGRVARARSEREALIDELRRVTGRGGRIRRLGDDAERARKAVTARIRDALRRIEDQHPDLGAHLRAALRTGTFCCYGPAEPTIWRIR